MPSSGVLSSIIAITLSLFGIFVGSVMISLSDRAGPYTYSACSSLNYGQSGLKRFVAEVLSFPQRYCVDINTVHTDVNTTACFVGGSTNYTCACVTTTYSGGTFQKTYSCHSVGPITINITKMWGIGVTVISVFILVVAFMFLIWQIRENMCKTTFI